MKRGTFGWRAAALAAAVGGAGCATTKQPAVPERPPVALAREDRVHNGVRGLLAQSGAADAESARAGDVLTNALAAKVRGPAKLPGRAQCYAAGCWLEVQFEGDADQIAKAAFELNRDVGEDRESAVTQWNGPRGRTALLRTDDGRIIEAWFLFVRGRSVSAATQAKQNIKLRPPMQPRAAATPGAKP